MGMIFPFINYGLIDFYQMSLFFFLRLPLPLLFFVLQFSFQAYIFMLQRIAQEMQYQETT